MLLIREVMYCKPGKVRPMVEKFLAMSKLNAKVGMPKMRAFFAGGNGGQVSMGIPDLDLVIAFTGGNYNDPVLFTGQRVYVPRYILPAVDAVLRKP